MFTLGDKIVYPMHGAGVIESIEEKKILGTLRQYYVLKIPFGDMKIMIPLESMEEVGIRSIVSIDTLNEVTDLLGEEVSDMSDNWNRRYRENMDKLRTGDIQNVAMVVRDLMRVDRVKRLSTGERKMLANAKQILISEIILVKELDQETASGLVAKCVFHE